MNFSSFCLLIEVLLKILNTTSIEYTSILIAKNHNYIRINVLNEKILILLRTFASLGFKVLTEHEKFDNFKICAAHRFYFGVNFAQSTQCNHPNHDIKKSRTLKCFLNIDYVIKILNIRKYVDSSLPFVMIGTGLCKICFPSISNLKFDSKVFIDSSPIKELKKLEFSKESTSKHEASAIQFGMV